MLNLDRICKFVVARAWSVHLLGLEMGLGSQRGVKAGAIGASVRRRLSSVVEARTELIARTSTLELNWVQTRSWPILSRLSSFANTCMRPFLIRIGFELNDRTAQS